MSGNTTPRLDLGKSAVIDPKVAYDTLGALSAQNTAIVPNVVYDALSAVRARSALIIAGLVAALALASAALVIVGPNYEGRAMIEFNFIREEPASSTTSTKVQPTASVDAMAVLDSASPVIRSHATAIAVVTRLGLDKDPAFARGSLPWRALSHLRSLLGFEVIVPSDRDLAEAQLLRRVSVISDPRSYLISISVTAADPERAATLANTVALEYLRGQLLQQLTDSYATAEREMSEISSIFGTRHPAYQSKQEQLEVLRRSLRTLREAPFDEVLASRVTGQSFIAAQKVMLPSGPNIPLVFGLTAVAELGAGALLALRPWRRQRAAAK